MQFRYAKDVESDEPSMLLNKHIGMDEEDGMGIDGSLFQEELHALDAMGKKRIKIFINSMGGVVTEGYNIVQAILNTKTRVDTYCSGFAASMAAIIFQTGRKRVMADYGILMYHNPYAGDVKTSPMLDSMKASLDKIIETRSGMDAAAVQRMTDNETFIEAPEAKKMGLCDEIESTAGLNVKNFPKEAKALIIKANKVLNKLFDSKNITMNKVTAKLNLNAEASEDAILEAVNKLEARAKKAEDKVKSDEDEMMDKDKKIKEAEDALAAMKAERDKAKADYDEMDKAKKEVEDKACEEKAKAMIADAVKIGKIKNDAAIIKEMEVKAKADLPAMAKFIDAIPVNKTAPRFEFSGGNKPENKYANTVGVEMAKLEMKLEKK